MPRFVSVWPELAMAWVDLRGRRKLVGLRSFWGFTAAALDCEIHQVGELVVLEADTGRTVTGSIAPLLLAELQDRVARETPALLRLQLERVLEGREAMVLGETSLPTSTRAA